MKYQKYIKFLAIAITVLSAIMVATTWGEPQSTAWLVALIGWLPNCWLDRAAD